MNGFTKAACMVSAAASLSLAACGQAQAPSAGGSQAAPASTAGQSASWPDIEAAADKEGSVTVYALNTMPPDQVGRFQDVWNKAYPHIKVDINAGLNPPDVVAKVTAEQDAKAFTGDVAQLGGTTGRQLDGLGALSPFIPPAAQDPNVKWRIDPVQDEAHKGAMLAGTLSYVPIWVNSNLVKPGDEPKTHLDVTDPKWKGKVVWQAPWTSGFGWNEFYLSKKYYGQDWITRMQAINPVISASSNDEINQLARGEYAIALAAPGGDLATRLIKAGQPLKADWPDDFVYGSANGFSVLNGAPHPNAAKVFVNWWLTQAGQQFYADLGQFPNRVDIPGKEDWMKGADHPKEVWYAKASDDAIAEPTQKEAASYFKK
jgi:ABC-type Fe3+ transport system substrate-binding protein